MSSYLKPLDPPGPSFVQKCGGLSELIKSSEWHLKQEGKFPNKLAMETLNFQICCVCGQ